MRIKDDKSIKKLFGIFIILLLILTIPQISKADDWNNGNSYNDGDDTVIFPQLHTQNGNAGDGSPNNSISKRVRELKVGDVFWITGWGNKNQSSRAPAIFCQEHGTTMTAAQRQKGKRLQYKITKVSRITSYSNHLPESKGLAYITTFERNGGNNFNNYQEANNDPVQNAFWTYSFNNSTAILQDGVLAYPLGEKGKGVPGEAEIVAAAENYRDYVADGISTSASISDVEANWNEEYTELTITYNLNYKNEGKFGNISNVTISYNGIKITGTNNKGLNTVPIINTDSIPAEGCNFSISVDYSYTLIDATICRFEYIGGGTQRGQNLVIASGKRWTETKNTTVNGKIPTKATNVSMQKYITQVTDGNGVKSPYIGRKNKYAANDLNNEYNHLNTNIISVEPEENISTGSQNYKESGAISIEAGDTVEYTIEVYNNSNVAADITLMDEMINTAEIRKIVKDNEVVSVKSGYPGTDTNNPNGYRQGILYEFNLGAKQKTVFKIELYYGVYDTNYSKEPLVNKAWIDTSPKNETDYRTIDADYIIMNEYKVSLEKWVSHRGEEINPQSDLINIKYAYIIQYLQGKTNQESLLNTLKADVDKIGNIENLRYIVNNDAIYDWNIEEYSNNIEEVDFNSDGSVNSDDLDYLRAYQVYNKLGESASTIIENYINADLNNDSKVNEEDFNIYKVLRANLYNGTESDETGNVREILDLDNKDIYMFILKQINADNAFSTDGLKNLKIKRLLKNKTKDEIEAEITAYIKSDVNDDGVVDFQDNYELSGTQQKPQIKIPKTDSEGENYTETYDLNITEAINNLDQENIKVLEENLNSYDINNDQVINHTDKELIEKLKNNEYGNLSENINVEDILKDIADNLKIAVTEDTKSLDYNNDNFLTIADMGYYEDEHGIQEIAEKLKKYDPGNSLDFDGDNYLSYSDYELVQEYAQVKNKIENLNTENLEEIEGNIENLINNYNIYDELSQTKLGELEEKLQQGDIIGGAGDGWLDMDYMEFAEFDIDDDGIINSTDLEQAKELIETQNGFDINDIYVIKVYKGIKVYKSEISNLEIEKYDFNNDNKITQEDGDEINDASQINIDYKRDDIDEFISFFEELLTNQENAQELSNIDTDINDSNSDPNNKLGDDDDYNLLNSIISNKIEIENYKTILENESLYKPIVNSNYQFYDPVNGVIQYTQDEYYSYLDANQDGILDINDKTFLDSYLESYREYQDENSDLNNQLSEDKKDIINSLIVSDINEDGKFNQDDIDILINIKNISPKETYDLNKDGYYDLTDINLFNEATRLSDSDKQSILTYLKNGGGSNSEQTYSDREGHAEYLVRENGKLVDKTENYTNYTKMNDDKLNNVVTVKSGEIITYTIKVKNDGETYVYITEVIDTLPEGVMLQGSSITYNTDKENNKQLKFTGLKDFLLAPEQEATFTIKVKVTERNMSIRLLTNTAEITEIKNKYGIEVEDSTPFNNKDSDYVQTKDITISGTVWNDKALDKKQDNYNGIYDEDQENKLSGIKVMLYRVGNGVIATTATDENGNYSFAGNYIKASKISSNNNALTNVDYQRRWYQYYSYYIIFEYDGITYTSTIFADVTSDNEKDSNAKEDNGPVEETRREFNDRFSTINNQSGIEYTTKNESGYIPQSNHIYNEETMAMQSSTNRINLSNTASLEQQLTHVNLGLRGRDVFDLSLTSDVYSTKVTVNGQKGTYNYNSNKVTVRKSDISVAEDAANFASEIREATVGEVGQAVRTTDLDVGVANNGATNPYTSTGLGIEVTYKITVTNESQTVGTASKVIDYYDSRYTFERAYIGDTTLNTQAGETGTGFKSVIITTTGNQLAQSETMDIYVVYSLNTPTSTLSALLEGTERIPTYNMAEVYEYKTYTTSDNEATRGLLDKDSAPGSANTETVRLTEGSSNKTTVRYYFDAQDLSKLKYEDDTYATPTLYFTKDDNGRKLSGTVFEDYTVIYNNNGERVKSGNGVQDPDNGEPGVNGVTVELIENGEVRYSVETKTNEVTGESGSYTFENFLPGNYVIRYHYGNTDDAFVVTAPNTNSYNGEDFQSTNNTGTYGAKVLNNTANIWYAYNEKEGVSTGTDNAERRKLVSENVVGFTDLQMQVLNNARDGKTKDEISVTGYEVDEDGTSKQVTYDVDTIKDVTYMFATTPGFTLSVEKTETDINNQNPAQKNQFSEYNVQNMNFGIAEVPVTTIDLQKSIKNFTIMDSANQNTIAKITKDTDSYSVTISPKRITENKKSVVIEILSSSLNIGKEEVTERLNQNEDNVVIKNKVTEDEISDLQEKMNQYSISEGIKITHGWTVEAGDVLAPPGTTKITAQIEDEKLQGAKLEITYEIIASMYTEKNFDNTATTVPSITGVIDYIDNDLSYNANLGNNSTYWELTSYTEALDTYNAARYECTRDGQTITVIPRGTLDPTGTSYTTIVKAKQNNPLLLTEVGTSAPVEITLEKTLSSQDTSIMDIITSSIDTYEYDNNIEITGLDYTNTQASSEDKVYYRDRVRNTERYIILAGSQHDSFASETLSIFPPTGENNSIKYYIIAITAIGILVVGIVLIKKYVIKGNDKK